MKHISNIPKLKLLEILNRISLFKSLSAGDRKTISDIPKLLVMIAKDELFIKFGDYDSSFFILLSGKASVTKFNQKIGEAIPGDFIGEVGFICNEARTANVIAQQDILAMKITSELFLTLPMSIRETIKDKILSGMVVRVTKQSDVISQLNRQLAAYDSPESAAEPTSAAEDLANKNIESNASQKKRVKTPSGSKFCYTEHK
jgi:CRP/FNR family cyclic AMP-dependent transcriptional regulator